MKKVALVFPTKILSNAFFGFILPPLGLERIAAHLEDICTIEIFDIRFEKDIIGELKKFNPEIIGVNIKTTMHAIPNYTIVSEIKKAFPNVPIVMGGLHATHCPEEALQFGDYVIRGDGELSFRDFVMVKPKEGIAGLCYKSESKIVKNALVSSAPTLNHLLPPARHLRKKKYFYGVSRLFQMDLLESSRGCTHFCTFCSPASTYPAYWRTHSPEYVLEEIKRIFAMGTHFCWLTDDQFGGNLDRLEKICDLIIEAHLPMIFFTFIRPFLGRMDLKIKMAKAGFMMISFGVESSNASQLIRYGKGQPNENNFALKVNQEFREAGIAHISNSYVFGDPMDSKETIAALGIYARSLDANTIEPLYSQPYPGTRYREELKEKGLLFDRPWTDFTEARQLVKHAEINEDELKDLRVKIWLDFLSPKKFFLQVSVPYSLYKDAKIPRLKVFLFMKRVEKSVFGCLLEDKIYSDRYAKMVHDYFHHYIQTYEASEMIVTNSLEKVLELFGLSFIKKWLDSKMVIVSVTDKKKVLASLCVHFSEGKVYSAYATTKYEAHKSALEFNIPLKLLASRMATESALAQAGFDFSIIVKNVFCLKFFRNIGLAFLPPTS